MGGMSDELRGPYAECVVEILDRARQMDEAQATLLSRLWETDELTDGGDTYLDNCQVVWTALDVSDRFLPLGWFEGLFADHPWIHTTRALHAVADTVCATLVRDMIPENVYTALTEPWTQAFVESFA